jgi:GntR family negative regulator for fad regulon and positive regulator of fabA
MKRTHEMVERTLVEGLLKGDPKPGSHLQSERELAARFAVSRATVREALLKLQNSGWISVEQRHATVVNDFWSQGDLQLLSSITKNIQPFPQDLASHLLELRVQFAPDYARRAVENDAAQVTGILSRANKLRNSSSALVKFDWELNLTMAVLSGNKIYPLIMNSFAGLYAKVGIEFFANEEHRVQARSFYRELLDAATRGDADSAEEITRAAMKLRLENFKGQSEVSTTIDPVEQQFVQM